MVLDAVEEVAQVAAGRIRPTPDFGGELNTDFKFVAAHMKGEVSSLLNIDKIIAVEAGDKLEAAA